MCAICTGCILSGKRSLRTQCGTNKTSEVQRDLPESVPTAIVYNPGMSGCKIVTNQALIVDEIQDVPPLRLRARILGMEALDRTRLLNYFCHAA